MLELAYQVRELEFVNVAGYADVNPVIGIMRPFVHHQNKRWSPFGVEQIISTGIRRIATCCPPPGNHVPYQPEKTVGLGVRSLVFAEIAE